LVFRICAAPRPKLWEIRADVPRALSDIVERAMAVMAADRFASAAELGAALAALPAASLSISGVGSTQAISGPPLASASQRPISAEALTPHSQTKPPNDRKGSGMMWTAAVAVALVGAGVTGLALQRRGDTAPLASGATAEPSSAHPATAPLPLPPPPEPSAQPSASPSASVAPAPSTAPVSSKPAGVGTHRPVTGRQQPTTTPTTPTVAEPTGGPPRLVPR
jgi:hypothetical protein